uniref:Uncharacterized protein n=1 Tax=Oryza meridionalis TaxID=40149 RepID=A0A0E0D321_9ORYZ
MVRSAATTGDGDRFRRLDRKINTGQSGVFGSVRPTNLHRICATPISMNEIDIVLVFLFDLVRICARQYLNRFSAICAQVSHNLFFNVLGEQYFFTTI